VRRASAPRAEVQRPHQDAAASALPADTGLPGGAQLHCCRCASPVEPTLPL